MIYLITQVEMTEFSRYPFPIYNKFYLNPEEIELSDLDIEKVEKPKTPNYEKVKNSGIVHILFPICWLSGCFGVLVIFGEFYMASFSLLAISAISYMIVSSFDNVEKEILDRNNKKKKEFENEILKHNKYIQEIAKLEEINNNQEKLIAFTLEKRKKLKESIRKPVEIPSKKGSSELFFLNKLKKDKRLNECIRPINPC